MLIKFKRRISGYSKVVFKEEKLEVESYEVLPPGTKVNDYHTNDLGN